MWAAQHFLIVGSDSPGRTRAASPSTDPDRLRNWLPTPEGSFRFAIRFYGPQSALLDGRYDMPGIVRTG